MDSNSDIDFVLRFDTAPEGTIYLSVSWQPDSGKDFGYRIIQKLDEEKYLAVGDVKGFAEMDTARLRRIMRQADAFLSLLPFRPDKQSKTSGFMLDELELAVDLELPIGILYDTRIAPAITDESGKDSVVVATKDGRQITIPRKRLVLLSSFDFGVRKSEELQLVELADFLRKATARQSLIRPYAFLISRLQPDFRLPRKACLAAAERGSGMPCYWIDSQDYRSNVDDTIERARLLIKHATFVVAEISLTDENPDFDNPSRAHEIGLATAYGKTVFPVSHAPRRHPYHGLVAQQLVWWDSEEDLYEKLVSAVNAKRDSIGRHVYNWELEGVDGGQMPQFRSPRFEPEEDHWQPPANASENQVQSWIYAVSFGVIVFTVALLLRHGVGYDDSLDLAAILAGVVTFMFSSRISRSIHSSLTRIRYLRWLIPMIAALLLAATIIFLRPSGNGAAMDTEQKEHSGRVVDSEQGQRVE